MCIADAIELDIINNKVASAERIKRLYYKDIDVTLEEIKEEINNGNK